MKLNNTIEVINQQWTDIYYSLHYVHQENISHQAIRILQHLEKNKNITVGNLANHLDVSHNTASEHTKRLIKKGYVTKKRSNQDERKVFVILTEKGTEILYRHTQLDKEKLGKVLQNLSDDDVETMIKALSTLSQAAKKCF
jgi:DNA-binding MarR family transcriptional regulator